MGLSLVEHLAELNDPRDRRGRQYPLVGLLTLCLVALLAGHTSPEAISQFGRLRQRRLGHALGFKNGKMPCANTISAALRGLDTDHLDRIIAVWLTDRHAQGWEHIALDGKRLCGSRDGEVPGTHLLAAYVPQASAVIAQMTVEATTNEHKAALRLLGVLPALGGTVVTADAMFTHTDVCVAIQQKGGDYILYAKDNQSELSTEIADTFITAQSGDFPPSLQRQWDEQMQVATDVSKGHGRMERRTLQTTTWLNEYLSDWPAVEQVFRLERQRKVKGKITVEVVYGITSLSSLAADAERLLEYTRGHWGIENGLYYTRI